MAAAFNFTDWCGEVLDQVRFRPDHPDIRRELEDHYTDHVRDLERIGFNSSLARERALAAMGDPMEVGRGLDRAHKPWLGWLCEISGWLAMALIAVLLVVTAMNGGWPDVGNWLDPMPDYQDPPEDAVFLECPEPFRTGSYTIEVEKAWYSWEEDMDRGWVHVRLQSSTPKFWLDPPVMGEHLEAETSDGVVYTDVQYPWISSSFAGGHLRSRGWISLTDVSPEAEWVEIRHKTAGWTVYLTLPAGEEGRP